MADCFNYPQIFFQFFISISLLLKNTSNVTSSEVGVKVALYACVNVVEQSKEEWKKGQNRNRLKERQTKEGEEKARVVPQSKKKKTLGCKKVVEKSGKNGKEIRVKGKGGHKDILAKR